MASFFVEMPSVDWREAADNWFDSCCCSFGGISEKMVASYAKSHACSEGCCLLTTTSITLYQADLLGFNSTTNGCITRHDDCGLVANPPDEGNCHAVSSSVTSISSVEEDRDQKFCHTEESKSTQLAAATNVASTTTCCSQSLCESASNDQEIITPVDLSMYQKHLLNGYLGNIFMFKSSGLSKDIEWIEFKCPKCSSLLGAYPSADGDKPIDSGIRLLKCYISTSPADSSGNLFREYTMERMFSAQLMQNANDELSFRIAVKDLKTKSLKLQMVLLNPDSWHCNGSCKEGSVEFFPMTYMHPVIKVLFSVSVDNNEFGSRVCESQRKDQMEELFMLGQPIKQVQRSLDLSSCTLPPSLTSLQGFSLAVLRR